MSAETLQQFLNLHQGCPTTAGDYHLRYETIICIAYSIVYEDRIELTIKPVYSNQDLGNGEGVSIIKIFPAPPKYNKNKIENERI